MMMRKAILVDRKVVSFEYDLATEEGKKKLLEWAAWYESLDNRRVAHTDVDKETSVSTVFLGINYRLGLWPDEKDLWFETMIFGGRNDGYTDRYETWEEAEAGHHKAVMRCRLAVVH